MIDLDELEARAEAALDETPASRMLYALEVMDPRAMLSLIREVRELRANQAQEEEAATGTKLYDIEIREAHGGSSVNVHGVATMSQAVAQAADSVSESATFVTIIGRFVRDEAKRVVKTDPRAACSHQLWAEGKAVPKTCARCALGPCARK
jgi:hypothetical protein